MLQNPMQKDWEHYKLGKNGKPLVHPMHVHTGDTVKVISGVDKGKVGTVKKVSPLKHIADFCCSCSCTVSYLLGCCSELLAHAALLCSCGQRWARSWWRAST